MEGKMGRNENRSNIYHANNTNDNIPLGKLI